MSRSGKDKVKYETHSELLHHNYNGETAARTRPFSFDEIMMRRKNKKLSAYDKEEAGEVSHASVENADVLKSEKGYGHSKDAGANNAVLQDFEKVSSRKTEERVSLKSVLVKGEDIEVTNSEANLKAERNKDTRNKHRERRVDERGYSRSRHVGESRGHPETEFEKSHSRDSLANRRYVVRPGGKSERESKRKQRNEDDEKYRSMNPKKKHDPGKWHNAESVEQRERGEASYSQGQESKPDLAEKKERRELLHSHHEESKPKRRRSRSLERHKDRDRRSTPSPREDKRTSYHGKEHSDVARNRMSSNGSNSNYRRHGGPGSGLGGYSPRKRRTEAAVKTPSPTKRSPEKKTAGWDLPPPQIDIMSTSLVSTNLTLSNQIISSNVHNLPNPVLVPSTEVRPLSVVSSTVLSTKNTASVDSVQLTQATRPKRRLYVQNVPASASEKALMECLNNFLLSSGVNYIQGTQPCISCIRNKEKGEALLEFLTPEDASAALSFDGRSFFGSILKIRRPKDFVDVANGVSGKLTPAVESISDTVKDTPHKIFIGGFSQAISSAELKEIASAFGTLKAYRFQVNGDSNEPCAFLEYLDQSITHKACAGLNGMKLGGQVLTVVQATPIASPMENTGEPLFYGIPEHAKPLLEKPTQVLVLNNVFNPEAFSSLPESELESMLEDIRIECARFGGVKSINLVKSNKSRRTTSDADKPKETEVTAGSAHQIIQSDEKKIKIKNAAESKETEVGKIEEGNTTGDDITLDELSKNDPRETGDKNSDTISREFTKEELDSSLDEKADDTIETKGSPLEKELKDEEVKLVGDNNQKFCHIGDVFEPGCVLVEFARPETACSAAHCLHWRLYEERVVTVGYVSHDLYKANFPN